MKCTLVSFFNSDNIGDILISNMLYDFVNQYADVTKISYGGDPFKFSDPSQIIETRNIKKTLPIKIKSKIYRMVIAINGEKMIEKFRPKTKQELEIESKISASDFLVIGGGNMIFDVTKYSRSVKAFERFVDMAKRHNKRIFAISLGIGPFITQEQEKKTVEALNKCDYITFRDFKSLKIYKKYYKDNKACLSIDPVFMHKKIIETKICNNKIGLNFFDNRLAKKSDSEFKKIKDEYIKLLKNILLNFDGKVILFSTDLNDYDLINDISNEVDSKKIEIREIRSVDSLFSLYSEIKLLIGCRMHSLIIAYTQHIPIIGLSWQPKVDAFFEIIDQKDSVFNYNDISSNLENINDLVNYKLNNIEKEKNRIAERLLIIQEELDSNKRIIKEFI